MPSVSAARAFSSAGKYSCPSFDLSKAALQSSRCRICALVTVTFNSSSSPLPPTRAQKREAQHKQEKGAGANHPPGKRNFPLTVGQIPKPTEKHDKQPIEHLVAQRIHQVSAFGQPLHLDFQFPAIDPREDGLNIRRDSKNRKGNFFDRGLDQLEPVFIFAENEPPNKGGPFSWGL